MICETGFVTNGIESVKGVVSSDPDYESLYKWEPDIAAFYYWRDHDKNWALEITKTLCDYTEYFIRLYRDGSGYVVFQNRHELESIEYFKLSGDIWKNLALNIRREVDWITQNPVFKNEDLNTKKEWRPYTTWAILPIHLKYNISLLAPKEAEQLSSDLKYEDTLYCDFEKDIPFVRDFIKAIGKEDKFRIPSKTQAERLFDSIAAEEDEVEEEDPGYTPDPDEEEYEDE